jgi:aminoglycoside 3-N-acetyltransferase
MSRTERIVPGVSIDAIVGQLRALGVREGDVLLAHVAFRAVRPVDSGPQGLIEAFSRAVGARGTIVMPSWTDALDRPFDPQQSEVAPTLGVVAALFWQLPGAVRSRTPFAFAARGPRAASIVANGLLLPPHQPDGAVGKVLSHDGRILLVGLNHDSNTMLHLAEHLAAAPYEQRRRIALFDGERVVMREYLERRHCFRLYTKVDGWLDQAGLQTKGRVGHASARLMHARDLIEVVVTRLRREPFSFLHPRHIGCAACDQAWHSVAEG